MPDVQHNACYSGGYAFILMLLSFNLGPQLSWICFVTTHMYSDSPSSESTSTSLLKRVVKGDQEAWERFVAVYGGFIYARCRRAGVAPQDAADLVQDVLKRVSKSIANLRRDQPGQGLRQWLLTITRNVIVDHFRKSASEREALGLKVFPGFLDEFPSPADDDDDESATWSRMPESVLVLRRTLDSVKLHYEHKTWQAFWLTIVEGRETADVAEDLCLAPGTIRQAKHKILKRLREELSGLL